MKISNKISLLVIFLLIVLAINTSVGIKEIFQMRKELRSVENRDIALTKIITSISHSQLEKTILLERVLRISEEIAYEEMPVARKKHLLDHANYAKLGFDKFAKESALKIIDGKNLINEGIKSSKSPDKTKELKHAMEFLRKNMLHTSNNLTYSIFCGAYTNSSGRN